jgi:hypothetical protein
MAKILCWEEKFNGGYCKNYPLKNKNKCHMHHEYHEYHHQDTYVNIPLVLFVILSSMLTLNYVNWNYNTADAEILLKEFLLKLYKIDKNMINVYMNTITLLATNYYNLIYTYITKTREFI